MDTTQEERDEWRIGIDPILHPASCKRITLRPDQVVRLINDADRLAAIERQVKDIANVMKGTAQVEADQGREGNAFMLNHWAKRIRAILDPPEGT